MNNWSDEQLVKLYSESSNKDAFKEIYVRYIDKVYRFVYSRTGNKTSAEDITSDTFITLINILPAFRGDSSLKSFIFGIAINKIRQFWSTNQKNQMESFDEETQEIFIDDDDNEAEVDKILVVVNSILDKLPENYKSILQQRFINGKNIKDTANLLNLSEENVRVIQFRAIKKAREIYDKLNFGIKI